MRRRFFILIIAWCFQVHAMAHASSAITHFRISHYKKESRFVFETNQPVHYKYFLLSQPERLVIDIDNANTKLLFSTYQSLLASTPVKRIRTYRHENKFLRVVLDLKEKTKEKLFSLKNPNRLVAELISDQTLQIKQTNKPTTKPAPVMTVLQQKKLRNVVVVIDPGHGGKDPGAIGRHGTNEKTVVLEIAKALARKINSEPGFTARLTRKADYFVPLEERLRIARKDHADMFVAIHADAFGDKHANGASVFALSERGATSTAARWLAERENRSEFMGGVDLGNKDQMLRSVLISLSQNHTIAVSLQIGTAMLRQLSRLTSLHTNRVDQAAFVVLKSPDIPSLLVETGFITNPFEERRLVNSHYQQSLAYALSLGIKDFFIRHPPVNTYLSHL